MPIAGRRHDEPGVPVRSGHQPRERHPGPAFGRSGCLVSFLPPSHAAVPVVSAVSAHGDRRDATVAGAEGPGVRVVSEDDARRPELVDQGRRLSLGAVICAVSLDGAGSRSRRMATADSAAGSDPRGRRCSSAVLALGGQRWCSRVGTGRRACRSTRQIPAAVRTGRRPATRPAGNFVSPGPLGRAARWRPGRR